MAQSHDEFWPPPAPPLPDGLVAVVKRDCPTCELVAPVLGDLHDRAGLTVITQDDPSFRPTPTGYTTTPIWPCPGITTSRPCPRCYR